MDTGFDSLLSTKLASIQTVKPDSLDESLLSTKPVSIQTVKPESTSSPDNFHVIPKLSAIHSANLVETCAKCGGPIIDKSQVFCKTCGVYIREEPSAYTSSIIKHPVFDPLVKSPAAYHNPQMETIKEQGAVPIEVTHISPNSKNKLRLIAIIAGIMLLFFIYMLMLLLIYLAEVSPVFLLPK